MPEKKFDLGDYVEVRDRIKLFYELYAQGRLVTSEVTMLTAPDDRQRVMVKALAYRTPEDTLPGVGYSWMEIPGTTSYTKGSELENTETSAWGRAIASLGILVDRSIASAQEVQNKAEGAPIPAPRGEAEAFLGILTKSGTVRKGDADGYKLDPREAPDGNHAIGFRLEFADKDPETGDRKAIPQVLCQGEVGEALYKWYAGNPAVLEKKKVNVRGQLFQISQPGRTSYYRLYVSRIETPDVVIPADPEVASPPEPPLEEPPADVQLTGEEPVQPALLAS